MSFLLATITSYNQSLDKRIGPHITDLWESFAQRAMSKIKVWKEH